MSTTESPSSPAGWKAGAKALAAFQKDHHGVAKGGMVDGGPRKGSKYATLPTFWPCAPRVLNTACLIPGRLAWSVKPFWYGVEVLHHESGESIYTEHPIPVPDKGLPGQRQQDLGGSITYARKYCLQGLYGLFADDGLDPDEISYGDAGTSQSKPSRSSTPKDSPEPPSPATASTPAPVHVTIEKPEQRALSEEEKKLALSIIKDKDKGAEWKADFMAKFYPSAEKLTASMVSTLEHLQHLEALQLSTPF